MLIFPLIALILVGIQSPKNKLLFSFSAKVRGGQETSKQSRSSSVFCCITFIIFSFLGKEKFCLDTAMSL